ncbi:glycosyltransferase [Thalassoglobus neptunius]|nr:glycosyltransferase [Thalassoglobus neptunius]
MDSTRPRVSFVIPARNEELLIASAIFAIAQSVVPCSISLEVIVVNDGSTDETAGIAKDCGAQVIDVQLHNIAAVRNAGAEVASGEILIFVDADTLMNADCLKGILAAVEGGAIAGGTAVEFDRRITWLQRVMSKSFLFVWQRIFGYGCGCCLFARRDVFQEIGGFDPTYLSSEERPFTRSMKKKGPFVLTRQPVLTSSRKFRLYSSWHLTKVVFRSLFLGKYRNREELGVFYDAPRESEI